MKRNRFGLVAIGLMGAALSVTSAWTQDDPGRQADNASRAAQPANGRTAVPRDSRSEDDAQAAGQRDALRGNNAGRDAQTDPSRGQPEVPGRSGVNLRVIDESHYPRVVSREETEEQHAYQQAVRALKDATNDADRQKAADTIRQHLDKQFERDMVQREQDLTAVEDRIRMLRQQLNKRKTSKDEIISLRLKTIQNDADGLGFPGEDTFLRRTEVAPGGIRHVLPNNYRIEQPGSPVRGDTKRPPAEESRPIAR
jgi:hypothetical protein